MQELVDQLLCGQVGFGRRDAAHGPRTCAGPEPCQLGIIQGVTVGMWWRRLAGRRCRSGEDGDSGVVSLWKRSSATGYWGCPLTCLERAVARTEAVLPRAMASEMRFAARSSRVGWTCWPLRWWR